MLVIVTACFGISSLFIGCSKDGLPLAPQVEKSLNVAAVISSGSWHSLGVKAKDIDANFSQNFLLRVGTTSKTGGYDVTYRSGTSWISATPEGAVKVAINPQYSSTGPFYIVTSNGTVKKINGIGQTGTVLPGISAREISVGNFRDGAKEECVAVITNTTGAGGYCIAYYRNNAWTYTQTGSAVKIAVGDPGAIGQFFVITSNNDLMYLPSVLSTQWWSLGKKATDLSLGLDWTDQVWSSFCLHITNATGGPSQGGYQIEKYGLPAGATGQYTWNMYPRGLGVIIANGNGARPYVVSSAGDLFQWY
jgi:hypothetical protein